MAHTPHILRPPNCGKPGCPRRSLAYCSSCGVPFCASHLAFVARTQALCSSCYADLNPDGLPSAASSVGTRCEANPTPHHTSPVSERWPRRARPLV